MSHWDVMRSDIMGNHSEDTYEKRDLSSREIISKSKSENFWTVTQLTTQTRGKRKSSLTAE